MSYGGASSSAKLIELHQHGHIHLSGTSDHDDDDDGGRWVVRASLELLNLLRVPLGATKRADVVGAEPARDALQVEAMVALAPRDRHFLVALRLVLDRRLVNAVAADRAAVLLHVPRPERHSVPLLHLESLLASRCRCSCCARGRTCAHTRVSTDIHHPT